MACGFDEVPPFLTRKTPSDFYINISWELDILLPLAFLGHISSKILSIYLRDHALVAASLSLTGSLTLTKFILFKSTWLVGFANEFKEVLFTFKSKS